MVLLHVPAELVPLRTMAAASATLRIPALGSPPKTTVFDASPPKGMGCWSLNECEGPKDSRRELFGIGYGPTKRPPSSGFVPCVFVTPRPKLKEGEIPRPPDMDMAIFEGSPRE